MTTSPPSQPTAEPMTGLLSDADVELFRNIDFGIAQNAVNSLLSKIDSLRADLREAREALEPFAKVGGIYPGLEDNARISMRRVNSDKSTDVLLGDLRRAARALAGKEKV